RPERLARQPEWGRWKPNASSVALSPLSDTDTAALIAALLGQPVLPPEVQTLMLEQAGGNPLYAEEFARLLTDRGLLVRHGRTLRLSPGQEIPFPETIQALIAGALDAPLPARGSARPPPGPPPWWARSSGPGPWPRSAAVTSQQCRPSLTSWNTRS